MMDSEYADLRRVCKEMLIGAYRVVLFTESELYEKSGEDLEIIAELSTTPEEFVKATAQRVLVILKQRLAA